MAEPILPQMQDITRQREMAKMLLERGMTDNLQGQMVSGRYVGASPLQGIANMYAAYSGRQMAKEADKRQQELAEMLRLEGDKDFQSYLEAVTPRAAVEARPEVIPQGQTMRDDQGMPTMGYQAPVQAVPEKKADYAEGMRVLRKSIDPETRALGKALLADQMKTIVAPEGSTIYRGSIGGTGQTIQGAPKKSSEQKDYEFSLTQGFKGTFMDYQTALRKANSQSINVQNAVPFQEKIYENSAVGLMKEFDTLKGIPAQVKQLDRVAELAPRSFAGSFADTKTQTAKFFNNNFGTNIATDKVNNTEELRAVLFTNIMDNLKKMDASPSQEQQRIMQASLGSIGTDPNALPKVVNVYKQILLDKAEEHNRRVGQTIEKGFKYPYDITVNIPKAAPAAAPAGNKLTPNVGDVQGGWRFKGGNPAIPSSWERVK